MHGRILTFCAWSLLSSVMGVPCADAGDPGANKWGPFSGQIIDVDTGQPIPGAVALAVWLETVPTVVEAHQRFYAAHVGVAGTAGRFEIPRLSRSFFNLSIDEPLIEYFAPGYVLAEPLAEPVPAIVRLRTWVRATPEQRRMHEIASGVHVWIPDERIVELKDHVNAERVRIGLHPIRMLSGGLPQ